METAAYDFRPALSGDLPMIRRWLDAPHVARWWGDDDPYDAIDLADDRIALWIVSTGGTPFGFMQDYDVTAWPGHHFGHLPSGSRGIDQLIGPADMIGKGHGTGFIAQRMRALFGAGAPTIATDPHPANARAIACYAKLGFEASGPACQSEWGLILPMVAVP